MSEAQSTDARAPALRCTTCGRDTRPLLALTDLPVHCNLLWRTREAALAAPRADMHLVCCTSCGHVFNATFDAERMKYAVGYENALDFSPTFKGYAENLAERLIETHDLRDKTVVEIGCGRAAFLVDLCRRGNNRGFGFDPSLADPHEQIDAGRGVTLRRDLYGAGSDAPAPDLLCCRHVLEHSDEPMAFLTAIRGALGEDAATAVFFEVPHATTMLRELGIWDLIYEHCSYFNAGSLARAFGASGFDVERVGDAFGGQFLCIEARAGAGAIAADLDIDAETRDALDAAAEFSARYRDKLERWRHELGAIAGSGRQAVIWGAGSKGVTFLNLVAEPGQIAYAVDLNPRKHGMFVAGSGQEILAPERLRGHRPDVIIVMNPIYEKEIADQARALGLDAQILCA